MLFVRYQSARKFSTSRIAGIIRSLAVLDFLAASCSLLFCLEPRTFGGQLG